MSEPAGLVAFLEARITGADERKALALCREFPETCMGSGGMGGEGGPCGAHLEVARLT